MNKTQIAESFRQLQTGICSGLENLDGRGSFQTDQWQRTEGGGGITKTIAHGALLSKGGVAFSEVYGPVSEEMKRQLNFDQGKEFYATGVSIVLHPENPHVPIIHMNVRYFEMDEHTWWFGGGIDLTPHYINKEQATWFHEGLKKVCDRFDPTYYPKFKVRADEYFYLPHREETRGIGGIFFDHLNESNSGMDRSSLLEFALSVGQAFVPLYSRQAEAGRNEPFSEAEIRWRNLRRGRYAEFNLAFDRGTKFGLHSGGRTESILMSLPPEAVWEYQFQAKEGSPEANTLALLKPGINWV